MIGWTNRALWVLLAVLLAAFLVRSVSFFGGIRGSDAYLYARFAQGIADAAAA